MNKIYLILALFLCGSQGIAQKFPDLVPPAPEPETITQSSILQKSTTGGSSAATLGAPIWSEDFANGFPAGWSVTDSSGVCPWVYSTDGSWGFFNGTSGTAAALAINSTTTANGFLISDVDSANNKAYGQPSGSMYKYLSTWFTTSAIDLTGHPYVTLKFEQYFRKNNSVNLNVQVSNDSITWTNFTVQKSIGNNANSPNPDKVKINITSIAGNQPKVYLRFGWSARVYFWMIDDIGIFDTPANDMVLEDHFINQDTSLYSGFYYYTPKKQTVAMDFAGAVLNDGYASQTNIGVNTSITLNSANVFNGNSAPLSSLASPLRDTLEISTLFTPASVGTYSLSTIVNSSELDADTSNNYRNATFWVTDSVFGRDGNTISSSTGNASFANNVATDDGFVLGNLYELKDADTVSSVSFRISNTKSGTAVMGELYRFDGTNWVAFMQTGVYDITAQDSINGWITLSFVPDGTSENLIAGDYIICGVSIFGSQGNVAITTDLTKKHIAQVTRLYVPATGLWYYTTGGIPFIRLNLKRNFVGVQEMDAAGGLLLGQNEPNPFTAQTMIPYELSASTDVSLEVFNVLGEKVFAVTEQNKPAGKHKLYFDGSALPVGLYTYTLKTATGFLTKKMTVTE